MMNLGFWQHQALLIWQAGRAPIVAAGVALAVWLAGRLLRSARLETAASGLALGAGWAVALGGVAVAPHAPAERLPLLAVAALAAGVAVDVSGRRWVAALAGLVLPVAAGWWLAGAPRSDPQAAAVLPVMACLTLAMLLAMRLLRAPPGPWSVGTAALALWGALAAAGAPPLWGVLALVPLAASLGQVGAPREAAAVRLPMAAGLVGMAAMASAALGRLGRGGLSRIELAALAPLLAIWVFPWLGARLLARLPGGEGGLAAAVASALPAVGLVWGLGRLGLQR